MDLMQHTLYAKVVEMLFNDQGMNPPANFMAKQEWELDLKQAEPYLRTLNEYELETFCIGDQDDMHSMIAHAVNKESAVAAHRVLDELFFELMGA